MAEEEKVKRIANFKAFAILGAILIIAGVVWNICADANQSPIDRALAETTEKPPVQEVSSQASKPATEVATNNSANENSFEDLTQI